MLLNEKPLVSIVVPCYNHERFVQDCIISIINQDYENIELIIIDDGSTDNSVKQIKDLVSICEKRFMRFEFRYRSNLGLSSTLNEAIAWCKGTFFSAIASDDVMLPDKTSIQVDYLKINTECIAVFGGVNILNKQGEKLRITNRKSRSYKFQDILLGKCSFSAPTQMIRFDKLKAVGGYRQDLIIEDWYMWLTLTRKFDGTIDNLNYVLAGYRLHDMNISKKSNIMHESRMEILDIFKEDNLYKKAKANAMLMTAHETQLNNKRESIIWFVRGASVSIFCVFQIRAILYLCKLMIPMRFIKKRSGSWM